MFTGIIEGLGTVRQVGAAGLGRRFTLEADFDLSGTRIGDSIAVNGVCLTVVKREGRRFSVDVAPETVKLTTFADTRNGARVNLERALRLGDRLDGHLVSGHVDGTGVILNKKRLANAILVTIGVSPKLARYMIKKGSVAADGVSLTLNACYADSFEVSIIPHTAKLTTIGFKREQTPVNIETDMIGKYVERFVGSAPNLDQAEAEIGSGGGVDLAFLTKNGFL